MATNGSVPTVTIRIQRFNPDVDKKPYLQAFQVKAPPGKTILDALHEIKEEQDGSLTFRRSCRHAICGSCAMNVNGRHMLVCDAPLREHLDRKGVLTLRPLAYLPIIKDLVVDRSAFDRIIQAGGFISVSTGSAPEANSVPVAKKNADQAMDAAACIGCGACVAACPNASAMLFTAAKVSHLSLLPHGQVERYERVANMVRVMDEEGFGGCTNIGECTAVCPKEISQDFIARLNGELIKATLLGVTPNGR